MATVYVGVTIRSTGPALLPAQILAKRLKRSTTMSSYRDRIASEQEANHYVHTSDTSEVAALPFQDATSHISPPLPGRDRVNRRGSAPIHSAAMSDMQRTYGNRAVQRYCGGTPSNRGKSASRLAIQRWWDENG